MLVSKTSFPPESLLHKQVASYHYTDSYTTSVNDPHDSLKVADAARAFFTSGPSWVGRLFAFRNRLVVLIGLKTSGKSANRQELLHSFKCVPGEQLGLFKIFACTEEEVILGEDDRHLDFRVSLLLNKAAAERTGNKKLTITTTVVFHNWLGRAYFLPVKPFHQLIVPAMLKGIVRELEKPGRMQAQLQ